MTRKLNHLAICGDPWPSWEFDNLPRGIKTMARSSRLANRAPGGFIREVDFAKHGQGVETLLALGLCWDEISMLKESGVIG